jgi:hypothetical protein
MAVAFSERVRWGPVAAFKTYAEVLRSDHVSVRAFEAGLTTCPPRLTLGDVLKRTGGVYETTLPLSPRFRDHIREVAELSGDEHLLRIAELEEVRISLEKFRDLDPQTRIVIGCRLEPTPEESARLPRDQHPSDPGNTLSSDDCTMPEGDDYTI